MNVILYDGDCGFCNYWVQWILKRDVHDRIKFAPLKSVFAQKFLHLNNLPTENFDTIYLLRNSSYFRKLNAIAEVGRVLGGKFKVLLLLHLIPRRLSDFIYDLVAKNRQKLPRKACVIPAEEQKKKFISD